MTHKSRTIQVSVAVPEHPMRFYARVLEEGGGYTAACDSVDLSGWGTTRVKALEDLLGALREAFDHVEAMAPPTDAKPPAIELVVLE